MSRKRCAPKQKLTQGKLKSRLLKNGVMEILHNLLQHIILHLLLHDVRFGVPWCRSILIQTLRIIIFIHTFLYNEQLFTNCNYEIELPYPKSLPLLWCSIFNIILIDILLLAGVLPYILNTFVSSNNGRNSFLFKRVNYNVLKSIFITWYDNTILYKSHENKTHN